MQGREVELRADEAEFAPAGQVVVRPENELVCRSGCFLTFSLSGKDGERRWRAPFVPVAILEFAAPRLLTTLLEPSISPFIAFSFHRILLVNATSPSILPTNCYQKAHHSFKLRADASRDTQQKCQHSSCTKDHAGHAENWSSWVPRRKEKSQFLFHLVPRLLHSPTSSPSYCSSKCYPQKEFRIYIASYSSRHFKILT